MAASFSHPTASAATTPVATAACRNGSAQMNAAGLQNALARRCMR
jgi:hypothetical protein